MQEFQRPLGETVKRVRLARGLTQAGLARQLNCDTRTILNIENGKSNPQMEILYPLIRFLKIDPKDIFYPDLSSDNAALQKMQTFLSDCSEAELDALLPLCQYFVSTLRTNQR